MIASVRFPLEEPATPCPYLAGLTAQFESYAIPQPSAEDFVRLIEQGFRHFGPYYFRPACAGSGCAWCGACVPLRVDVQGFQASDSQRRVLRQGKAVRLRVDVPECDERRYAIYLAHNRRFPPPPQGDAKGDMDYQNFAFAFYSPAPYTLEFSYYVEDVLIAFSLLDVAQPLASSVYCAFDPEYERFSPGTLSVLRELQFARALGLAHYHLGYSMQANASLAYKQNFRPSEFYDGETWRPLRDARGAWLRDAAGLRMGPMERLGIE